MPIELDQTFKNVILRILNKYKRNPRFEEDCRALELIVETEKTHHGHPIEGVEELRQAIFDRCRAGLKSNKKLIFFDLFTWTTKTEDNDLFSDLCCTMFPHFTSALVRDTRQYKAALSEKSKLLEENSKLKKESELAKAKIVSLKEDEEKKNKCIESLIQKNTDLEEQLRKSQEEVSNLKVEVRGLKEITIPELRKELTEDFDDKLEKMYKQMAEMMKVNQSSAQSEPMQQEPTQSESTQPAVSEKVQHVHQTGITFFDQKTGGKNQSGQIFVEQDQQLNKVVSTNPFDY